ncbi:MAG: TIGR03960 family B12-binding radical SAM protein [Deltaproteobacteria bacterium]|nr:MAG: TIGR03960 family B12-binding radical SAM protein [Deltaproteobacteria bacterium]
MNSVTMRMPENIGKLFAHVKKPSRYVGNEINACYKHWDEAELRVALVFPDLYEIGMSHHGLQILYSVINAQEGLLADRVYAPDKDLEELLQSQNVPIFAVESRRALAEFDMIGITLPYELCYTNILTILDLGGIPFRTSNRDDSHPFIIGGGSGSFNPEPAADFFDAILLGDGEEAVLEITEVIRSSKRAKLDRHEILEKLAAVPGVYVPSFFEPLYDRRGKLLEVKSLKENYNRIQRRILPDLEISHTPGKPIVPLVRIVHDRLGIEVARGCTRGCRFCQAGIIYRPVRERTAGRVVELAEKGMQAGGFDELALLSLSTGDYSCLSPALGRLMDRFVKEYVSVSMPSMRVGTLTPEIMSQIKRVRKTGFTLAPEAGTDRLRKIINKGITEEDLLSTCRDANILGWKLLKFYFMFGLPTETEEDVKAIADLVRRAAQTSADRRLRINVSVATFVPKPHTPFQWEPQISIDEAFARIDLLKRNLPKGNYKLKWHDPRQSFLEGVMSRGDRLLSRVIEEAWQKGARLDAWTEHYDLNIWQDAADSCKIDFHKFLQRRDFSEILPWQHLDTGVDMEFLRAELERSLTGEYTPDCRMYGCQNCGACDFKEVKPVVQCIEKGLVESGEEVRFVSSSTTQDLPEMPSPQEDTVSESEEHHWYRLSYSKQGDIRFLSHLEVIQVFFQAFRRAAVKLHYTQGFNPVPKASFSPALPVGTESLAEYLDLDLSEEIKDKSNFLLDINDQLPSGIRILSVAGVPERKSDAAVRYLTCYKIRLDRDLSSDDRDNLDSFMDKDSFTVKKMRKGRQRILDIRKQVKSIDVLEENSFEMILFSEEGKAAGKPAEIIKAILNLTDEECLNFNILKTWNKAVQ